MQSYNKTPLTYEQHVELLTSRGLVISNPKDAVKFLKQVNYYRFSTYCVPFQHPHDVFIPRTTFEEIVNLYRLDAELRDAIFALLAPIEIYFRTQMAYELSHKWGTFAQYDSSIFKNGDLHKEWLDELEKDTVDSNEPFIKHYQTKYSDFPRLPLWMACEIMSLGSVSKCYSNLMRDAQLLICTVFEVKPNVLRSWLHTITFLRNICAHHGRLWNRNLSISPLIPNKHIKWQTIPFNNKKIFAGIAIMEWICHCADLPLCNVESVYETMQKIATLNRQFADMMGILGGGRIGMCWENK